MAEVSDDDTDILFRSARPPDRTEVTGPLQTDVYDVWEPAPDRARGVTVGPRARRVLARGVRPRPRSPRWPRRWPATASTSPTSSTHAPGCRAAAGRAPAPPSSPGSRRCTPTPTCPTASSSSATRAGGHLALWLACGEPRPLAHRASWRLAPAADLGEVDRLGLSDDAARDLLGGTPDEVPDAWADADPARQHLTVPAVIVTGELDDVVPAASPTSYVASRSAGEPLRTAVARRADHFDVIDPTTDAYLLVLAEIEELTLTTH